VKGSPRLSLSGKRSESVFDAGIESFFCAKMSLQNAPRITDRTNKENGKLLINFQ